LDRFVVGITPVLGPRQPLSPHDSADKLLSSADYRQGGGNTQGKSSLGNRTTAARRHLSSRDATSSPSGIEFRSVSGLILECLESPGRRPCRSGTSLGRPRCLKIRCTTDACSMSATRRSRPPGGARGEDAVVENQVDSRPRRQLGEPLEQFQRIKTQVRRPVRPAVPQREPDRPPPALTCSW